MKKSTTGKRFSQITETEYSLTDQKDSEALAAYFRGNGTINDRGQYFIGGWRNTVSTYCENAKAFLKSKGLPSSPRVFKTENGEWLETQPENALFKGGRSLHVHIRKNGYERDSLEDLAAQIIEQSDWLEKAIKSNPPNIDSLIQTAMNLERAYALAQVYGIESITNTQSRKGKQSPNREWATKLAIELAKKTQHPQDRMESNPRRLRGR